MFTGRFTFNTSSTSDGNGGTYNVPADWNINQINNTIYKKTIIILIKTIGLGDIVDFITKYTGIKYLIIKATKGNCGCEARRKKFNQYVSIPYIVLNVQPIINMSNNNVVDLTDDVSKSSNTIKKPCGCANKKKV